MKCEDCELRMAEFDFGEEIEAHLLVCADCRGLAGELRENAVVLSAMREEELPPLERASAGASQAKACATILPTPTARNIETPDGGLRRRRGAVAAAAAVALLAIALPWHRRAPVVPAPSSPAVAAAAAPAPEIAAIAPVHKLPRRVAMPKPPEPEETLMVKMLTPDPDIVIYWIVEPKEKSE